MDRYAADANRMVADEEAAREAEDAEVARLAGTCCSDPTPEPEERGEGIDEGKTLRYCSSCGSDLEPAQYAAIVADLEGTRERIRRIRAQRREGDPFGAPVPCEPGYWDEIAPE